jgi:hypothetical protein
MAGKGVQCSINKAFGNFEEFRHDHRNGGERMSGVKTGVASNPAVREIERNIWSHSDHTQARVTQIEQMMEEADRRNHEAIRKLTRDHQIQMDHSRAKANKNREQTRKIIDAFQKHKREQFERIRRLHGDIEAQNKKTQKFTAEIGQKIKKLSESHGRDIEQIKHQMTVKDLEIRRDMAKQEKRIRHDFNREINALANEVDQQRRETKKAITQIRNQFGRDLNDAKEDFRHRIHELGTTIQHKEDLQYERSVDWMNACNHLIDDIKEKRHSFFMPGKLNVLIEKYNRNIENTNSYAYQTMIANATALFDELVMLSDSIDLAEMEWMASFFALQDNTAHLVAEFKNAETLVYELDSERASKKISADVDYWSNHQLSALKTDIRALLTQVERSAKSLTKDEMDALSRKEDEFLVRLNGIIDEAKSTMLLSQSRFETAQRIDQTMQTLGYHLVDHTYESKDPRKTLYVKLADGLGNEMVISLAPDENIGTTFRLDFDFFNKENDEAFFTGTTQAIYDQLRDDGLDIATMKSLPGYERKSSDRHELRNIETIRDKVKAT